MLTTENLEALQAACDWWLASAPARRVGGGAAPAGSGDCCCPWGALLRLWGVKVNKYEGDSNWPSNDKISETVFGELVSFGDIDDFMRGFDEDAWGINGPDEPVPEAWQRGVEFRIRYAWQNVTKALECAF